MRPRRCEWLPLSTQQLRLRNLQRIQGLNINCQNIADHPVETLLYYTLHHNPKSESFYQSELLPYRKQLQQMWAEIQCETLVKSNANYVCVRMWRQEKADVSRQAKACSNIDYRPSALVEHLKQKDKEDDQGPRKLIFSWIVHFSGLIPIPNLTESKYLGNCLIFQINDEYFTSPEYFVVENSHEEILLKYKRYTIDDSRTSSIPLNEYNINSPRVSRNSSPSNYDFEKDILLMAKMRYNEIHCKKEDVKISYNLEKLLRLQRLQRHKVQIERENIELMEQIKCIHLRCITKEQVGRKPHYSSGTESSSACKYYSTSNTSNRSIGRTLRMILAEQQQIDPIKLLKAKKLQQQLESLYSKERLLLKICDSYKKRIFNIKGKLTDLTNARQKLHSWLEVQQQKLKSDLSDLRTKQLELRNYEKRKRFIIHHIQRRMSTLCIELQDIYPIRRNGEGFHTICNVPYPSLELGCFEHDSLRIMGGNSIYAETTICPISLGVALGYVAHLVQIMATVLNRPLRNPIIYEGSQSRIVDAIQEIPTSSREFPLYSRSVAPTASVKNAIHLLNQNITQLCYDITSNSNDVCKLCNDICKRSIMENILNIYNTLNEIQEKAYETDEEQRNSIRNGFRNRYRAINFSMDTTQSYVNHIIPTVPQLSLIRDKKLVTNSIEKRDTKSPRRRACRSVGSYKDNQSECQYNTPRSHSDTDLMALNLY